MYMNRSDTNAAVRRQASQNWKAVGNFPKFIRENLPLVRREMVRGMFRTPQWSASAGRALGDLVALLDDGGSIQIAATDTLAAVAAAHPKTAMPFVGRWARSILDVLKNDPSEVRSAAERVWVTLQKISGDGIIPALQA